jgi:hypothetical protein
VQFKIYTVVLWIRIRKSRGVFAGLKSESDFLKAVDPNPKKIVRIRPDSRDYIIL